MPYSAEDIEAAADELLRHLQVQAPPGRGPAIANLGEVDPALTTADLQASAPPPETLLGGPPTARRPRSLLTPLPYPQEGVPDALQPQSEAERRALQNDATSFGVGVGTAGTVAATNPIIRGTTAAVAAAPRVATAIAGLGALTANSATAQAPGDPVAAASQVDDLIRQQTDLRNRQKALTEERGTFTTLSTPDQIREAQRRLNALGYDAGNVDGREGARWRDALRRYNADRQTEMQDISKQLGGLDTQISAARRAADLEIGNERLREAEANVSPGRRAMREWGPAMGYALGLLGIGPLTRWGVTANANRVATNAATKADDIMAETGGGVAGRVGRVNDVWTRGQPRHIPYFRPREEPFPSAPGTPSGFRSNPNAPQAGALYQPSHAREQVENIGITAAGIGDYLFMQYRQLPIAQQEVREARQALEANPTSEVALRRYQAAKDMEAIWSTVGNLGVAGLGGYFGGAHFMPRSHVRPDMSLANAERIRLDRMLARENAPAAPTSAATAPALTPLQLRARAADRVPAGQPGGGRFKGE